MAETVKPVTTLVKEAQEVFREQFGEEPEVAVFAPGRVNLIGEHTDYNDGFVMPMALPLVTVIVGKKVEGDESVLYTTSDFSEKKATFQMPSKYALIRVIDRSGPKWAVYVKGVAVNYIGEIPPAFKAVIHSSVPIGGGLSSSASLEVATYIFLDALTGCNAVLPTDKALACQKAEHDYAGMPCGIMDQFIAMMGKEGYAVLIDCRHLTSRLIPVADENIVFLVTNSNVKHELTGSEYSSRRRQCQEVSLLLKKASLRDAHMDDIEYLQSIDTDDETVRRARHVVTEIQRTVEAAEMLKEMNYHKFGELMTKSHLSLKEDYNVSCPELDQLVELALQCEGVLGSRMTGGGFGGCTVTLVYSHVVDNVISYIKQHYNRRPTFFICKPSAGASRLQV